MEKRELICIGCPMGCPLTVTLDGGAVVTVQGNTCPRGDAYARKEVTAPTRIVTTTVRVTGGTLPAVSCKTRQRIWTLWPRLNITTASKAKTLLPKPCTRPARWSLTLCARCHGMMPRTRQSPMKKAGNAPAKSTAP